MSLDKRVSDFWSHSSVERDLTAEELAAREAHEDAIHSYQARAAGGAGGEFLVINGH